MSICTLTEKDKAQIDSICNETNCYAVSLNLKGSGCAGFEYEWTFEDEQDTDDHVIDNRLLVHRTNELYLTGIEIDYNSETFGSFFTFNNPKAKSQCGCGTSFSI